MKKRLWYSGLSFGGVLLFFGGLFLWSENALKQSQKEWSQAHSLSTKGVSFQEMLRRENVFRKSFSEQVGYLEGRELKRPLDLLVLSDLLDELSSVHRLSKVGFSVTPLDKKEKSKFEVLQVTLELDAFQDTSIYEFLWDLNAQIYGLVSPIRFKLTRDQVGRGHLSMVK
ncbi:MAG: hypothetical protein GY915_00330 [bacterium]|nr:hypothetical protein [bacterium]